MKTQIQRLQKRLKQGSVWIKFEHEHTHCGSSLIKRVDYYHVKEIVEYPSSLPNTFKIIYDERIITDFRYTNNKVTYTFDPVWQSNKNYLHVTNDKFKIVPKISKKVIKLVTEYITKERKRINDWADSWFNFLNTRK